jgi:hypothetical protein
MYKSLTLPFRQVAFDKLCTIDITKKNLGLVVCNGDEIEPCPKSNQLQNLCENDQNQKN